MVNYWRLLDILWNPSILTISTSTIHSFFNMTRFWARILPNESYVSLLSFVGVLLLNRRTFENVWQFWRKWVWSCCKDSDWHPKFLLIIQSTLTTSWHTLVLWNPSILTISTSTIYDFFNIAPLSARMLPNESYVSPPSFAGVLVSNRRAFKNL